MSASTFAATRCSWVCMMWVLQGSLDMVVGTAVDLCRAILGGDLLMGNVVLPLLLQLVCHAHQEVCAEVVHAHIAPSVPQLPGAWKHRHTLVNVLCNTRFWEGAAF